MKNATEIRQAGKVESEKAIKDAETGQRSLGNAIAVLRSFYQTAHEDEGAEFLQTSSKGDASKRIISVLEAVMEDFSKMEAETTSQEVTDQREYEEAMRDNKIERARRRKESDMKANEIQRHIDKINVLESSEKNLNAEYDSGRHYLRDLLPACKSGDSTYEE